jgi:hypothetical protein
MMIGFNFGFYFCDDCCLQMMRGETGYPSKPFTAMVLSRQAEKISGIMF